MPPGRSALCDRRQQRGVDGAQDIGEQQVGRPDQRSQHRRHRPPEIDRPADAVPRRRSAPRPHWRRRRSRCRWRAAAPSCTAAMARMPLPLPRSSTSRPAGAAAPAAPARHGWNRARRCRMPISGSSTTVQVPGRSASAIQEGITVSRPKWRGPSPSRQRVDQSTDSSSRRASGDRVHLGAPADRSSASAPASSGAKVTSVPSSRSSTACPVRATSQAPMASRSRRRAVARRWPTSSCAERFLELGPEAGARLGGSPSSFASS